MPPRRSSRTRASVEPQPPPQVETVSNPAKRKRSQPPVDVVVEKENVEKPPSRSRRSSATRSSVGNTSRSRTSTRNASVLDEVPETGDEEEEESRPMKKKRPSSEKLGEEEDEDMDEIVADENDDDAEEEYEEKKPKGRRTTTTKRKVSAAKGRQKATTTTRAKAPKKVQPVEEEDDDESDGEPELISKAPDPIDEDEDEDEDEIAPPPRKPRKAASVKSSQPTKRSSQTSQPEEEISLFDPPPPPTMPVSQPQTIVEPESNEPKPRLVIHKLTLVNFKSYGGRQEIGPFHKSFSSIVGPNGSGKSNTIDALLFVFGYRATKMRQGKLGELIHNSARYPDLDECSVEIHFREIIDLPGPDAFEVVPQSDLIVARHAYKNNSSKYTINGKQSSYTEVQKLLKGRGIDLDHKRFLILQGEVESIALMKPKAATEHDEGLLEYLEDIIGTAHYKEPIQEAMDKLEALNEVRQTKMNRLRLVEKEKEALSARREKALEFQRMQNDLIRKKGILYQLYVGQGLKTADDLEGQLKKLGKDLEKEIKKNEADVKHLEELEEHYRDQEQAYQELHGIAREAQKELAEHEKKEVGANERKKHAAGKVKKLSKTVTDETNVLRNAERAIIDSTEKATKEKQKLDGYEKSLVVEEKELAKIQDSLKDKTQVYYDQKEVLQRELQPWTAKINAKESEINIATSERDTLVAKGEQAKKDEEEANEKLATLKSDMQEKLMKQEQLKADKAEAVKKKGALEKKIEVAQAESEVLNRKAAASNAKVQEARASQAENKSRTGVLAKLTELRDSGRLTGFHGRLGNLGTIPDEYDVAVSTASGQLYNMVCDTVEEGQKCIEHLRKTNAGRASFMILDKISFSPDQMQRKQTPENAPRLFDLITIKNEKFRPAFYKALGDTLVAKDMTQANRIAYDGPKRWRVVTLTGQLIDTSGTMSGGGNKQSRGAMSSKFAAETVRPEVMRQWEDDSREAAAQLQAKSQEIRDAQAELAAVKKSIPEIEHDFAKLVLELETGKTRVTEAEKTVKALKTQSKLNDSEVARIAQLEETVENANADMERLKAKAEKITKQLKEVEDKILQIGGSKLLAQKSKVEGLQVHITLANDEITKAEVTIAKSEKDVAKYTASLETNEATLNTLKTELKALEKEVADLSDFVSGLKKNLDNALHAEESSKEVMDELKGDLDEKTEEVQKFRQKEGKIRAQIEAIEKEHQENEGKISHWQAEFDKLRLEEIDDDDEEEEDDANEANEEKEEKPDEDMEGDEQDGEGHNVKADPDAPPKRCKKDESDRLKPPELSAEELKKYKVRELGLDVEHVEDQLKLMNPNLDVIAEYRKRQQEVFNRHNELESVTKERDDMKKQHDDLRKQRLEEFMTGFSAISLKLKEMYQMITLGGNAELELVDSMDPFSEGIIFSVMPPKKSWKNIANLSGGEKTLSSLALVFALHVFKPTPLYFMDEIDAALDFRNVSIVANYIKDRTKNAQFIIISLRNDMFELSQRLIGIYKTANVTQSISIDNHALRPSAVPA